MVVVLTRFPTDSRQRTIWPSWRVGHCVCRIIVLGPGRRRWPSAVRQANRFLRFQSRLPRTDLARTSACIRWCLWRWQTAVWPSCTRHPSQRWSGYTLSASPSRAVGLAKRFRRPRSWNPNLGHHLWNDNMHYYIFIYSIVW